MWELSSPRGCLTAAVATPLLSHCPHFCVPVSLPWQHTASPVVSSSFSQLCLGRWAPERLYFCGCSLSCFPVWPWCTCEPQNPALPHTELLSPSASSGRVVLTAPLTLWPSLHAAFLRILLAVFLSELLSVGASRQGWGGCLALTSLLASCLGRWQLSLSLCDKWLLG